MHVRNVMLSDMLLSISDCHHAACCLLTAQRKNASGVILQDACQSYQAACLEVLY